MPTAIRKILCLLALLSGIPIARADSWTSQLISHAVSSESGNAASGCQSPALQSADGRYAAFCSNATNLVLQQQDVNEEPDVFLRDLQTGQTILVSHSAGSMSAAGNGQSIPVALSSNGRFLLYFSRATNLIAGLNDVNAALEDAFLYDRETNSTLLVSRAHGSPLTTSNSRSFAAGMSDDGNWIAISSTSTDLLSSPMTLLLSSEVFLFSREQGSMQLVSRSKTGPNIPANHPSVFAGISGDGSRVLLKTFATDIVDGVIDTNNDYDLYCFNRIPGTYELISHTAGAPNTAANDGVYLSRLSKNGNRVLITSAASDLIPGAGDTNQDFDVFLKDIASGTMTLVSRSGLSATTSASGRSLGMGLSADGSRIIFESEAVNVQGMTQDANASSDAFVFDLATGLTKLVSRATNETTVTSNGSSSAAAISADGNLVLYRSTSTNVAAGQSDLIDTSDIFLFNVTSGVTTLVTSVYGQPNQALARVESNGRLSDDGLQVSVSTDAGNFVAPARDTNDEVDIFNVDLLSGTVALVSTAGSTDLVTANNYSGACCFSADGESFLLVSAASNLEPGVSDTNLGSDIFIVDAGSGNRTRVTRSSSNPNATPAGWSGRAQFSLDGNFVLFESEAPDLVSNLQDANGPELDVFLFDRVQNTTTLVSRSNHSPLRSANGQARPIAISANGQFALYASKATDVVPGATDANGSTDLYLFDRSTGQSILVSRAFGLAGVTANQGAFENAMLSSDGGYVLYSSGSTNVVTGVTDVNGLADVYLFDRSAGTSRLISRRSDNGLVTGNSMSEAIAMTPSAGILLFSSAATDLVSGVTDLNGGNDVFLFDTQSGGVSLVSRAEGAASATGNAPSSAVAISDTGDRVVFSSLASNLIPGAMSNSPTEQIFLFDRLHGTHLVSRRFGTTNVAANGASIPGQFSGDGNWLTLTSQAQDLVAGIVDSNGAGFDGFLYDVANRTHSLVSRSRGTLLSTANDQSYASAVSADGRLVILSSKANNIATGVSDGNLDFDSFLMSRRFRVSISSSAGGSVSPLGDVDVDAGQRLSLTLTADPGFQVGTVSGCGGTWTGANPLSTAPIRADCTVSVSFTPEAVLSNIFANGFE